MTAKTTLIWNEKLQLNHISFTPEASEKKMERSNFQRRHRRKQFYDGVSGGFFCFSFLKKSIYYSIRWDLENAVGTESGRRVSIYVNSIRVARSF